MPRLSCWSCGRQIYTVAPLEALFAEERRCPRCGAFLREDRRETERRSHHRRMNPQHDPGPPKPKPAPTAPKPSPAAAAPDGAAKSAKSAKSDKSAPGTEAVATDPERRLAERRTIRRRGSGVSLSPAASGSTSGWRV